MLSKLKRALIKWALPKEMYELLVEIGNEVNVQENHCTARPLLFKIEEADYVYGIDPDYHDCEQFIMPESDDPDLAWYFDKDLPDNVIEWLWDAKEKMFKSKFGVQVENVLKLPVEAFDVMEEVFADDYTSTFRALKVLRDWDVENIPYGFADDLENLCHEMGYDPTINYRTRRVKYSNAFFTQEAAEHHIKINGHNMCEPRVYCFMAYRNYEFENISEFLSLIATNEKAYR